MKRCPQCGRDYNDDSLSFCLDDGSELLFGPAPGGPSSERGTMVHRSFGDEPQTAILHTTVGSEEAATRAAIYTTEGTAIHPPETASTTTGKRFDRRLILAPIAAAVIVFGVYIAYRYFNSATSEQITSIAVLPFQNRSDDADTDYLSDGLAESLIFRLTQLPGLKVSPTNAVMRYKGKNTDVSQIAGDLGVDAVMTGRLVKRGDNLNITVELVDIRNNKSLWGEQYERKMSDLLVTQREIATIIAEKLQLKLSGDDAKGLTKKYTESNEAYQLYLKGRHQWNKRIQDSLKLAAESYSQAIEKDPGFALAYAGLAETYVLFPNYEVSTSADSMPRAKAAALRALELDDSLAEAHTALGWYFFTYEYDFAAGERELRRAIELNPNYATAHQWLAELLGQTKRFDEARAASARAQQNDALSPVISFNSGWHYYLTRRYDDAIKEFSRTLSQHPDFGLAHAGLCWANERKGDLAAAIPSCRKAADATQSSYEKAYLSLALARAGQRAEAAKILEELKANASRKYVPSIAFAMAHHGLGNKEEALLNLEKEVEERGYWASSYAADPALDDFRSEPRFKALLKKMNLPE